MNEFVKYKGALDLKQIPEQLQNLRRAILLFFLTLMGTSFAVLVASVVSNN